MAQKRWTFLSNHARVFAYLAEHPDVTAQSLAFKAHLSIRAVQIIMDDLEDGGYLTRERVGRHNRYRVNPDGPLRHSLERGHRAGAILQALDIKTSGLADSGSRSNPMVSKA